MPQTAAAEELDDEAGDSAGEGDEVHDGEKAGTKAIDAEAPPPIPQVHLRYGGHCEWLEACPLMPEGLSASSLPCVACGPVHPHYYPPPPPAVLSQMPRVLSPHTKCGRLISLVRSATHAELVVRSITNEAERLMAPALSRPMTEVSAVIAGAAGVTPKQAALPGAAGAFVALSGNGENECCGDAEGSGFPRVVYDAYPTDGGSPHAGTRNGSLLFDADFETANLRRAVQVAPSDYNLVLNCDVNTRGHTQWSVNRATLSCILRLGWSICCSLPASYPGPRSPPDDDLSSVLPGRFLFRVRGMNAGVGYRLHLINLMKPDSLFSSGMRPLAYSERHAQSTGVGWVRTADEIAYFANQYSYSTMPKKPSKKGGSGGGSGVTTVAAGGIPGGAPRDAQLSSFYTLTFRVTFDYKSDTVLGGQLHSRLRCAIPWPQQMAHSCASMQRHAPATPRFARLCLSLTRAQSRSHATQVYIAQCYPYTYTMAQQLSTRLLHERRSALVRKEVLCHSYGGNVVDLITVTDFSAPPAEVAARKGVLLGCSTLDRAVHPSWFGPRCRFAVVVLSARVHPGESNASWMMHGLLEALTADSPDARLLRRTVVFKIVPMLNPDGVILVCCRPPVEPALGSRPFSRQSLTRLVSHLLRATTGAVSSASTSTASGPTRMSKTTRRSTI